MDVDPDTWTLTIDGNVDNPLELSIADLRERFEVVTMALVIECGGNGRAYFNPPASGNQWTVGAVGCSEWTGVRLKDVLEEAGVQSSVVYTGHYGADEHLSGDPDLIPISRGLPIDKAMTDNVLIAFEQNGEPIHIHNGAPLRLVVPGWPGSCSQKNGSSRIQLRDQVHDGPKMGGTSYRVPGYPVAPGQEIPEEDFVIMERMPVKSLITHPADGDEIGGETQVRGHAWSGDRTIRQVDISTDFGATWANRRTRRAGERRGLAELPSRRQPARGRLLRDLGARDRRRGRDAAFRHRLEPQGVPQQLDAQGGGPLELTAGSRTRKVGGARVSHARPVICHIRKQGKDRSNERDH